MKANTLRNLAVLSHAILLLVCGAAIAASLRTTQPEDRWRIASASIVGIAIGFQLSDIVYSRRFRKLQRETDARYDKLLAKVEDERSKLISTVVERYDMKQ